MILKREITDKASEQGVLPDTVDKDWVLGHFLRSFFSHPDVSSQFVFKGGTGLRKGYFFDYRFSEDLDFTLLDSNFDVDKFMLESIAKKCSKETGILFWVQSFAEKSHNNVSQGYECKICFWGANHKKNSAPAPKERWQTKIKIDISFTEIVLTPIAQKEIIHPYTDNSMFADIVIPIYSLTETLTEKVRSFYQRSYDAPRDYYDVWYLLKHHNFQNWSEIFRILEEKCLIKNIELDTSIFSDKSRFHIVSKAWESSLARHIDIKKLPKPEDVWVYLDRMLFSSLLS